MTATKELWMIFCTFVLTVLFSTFFIWPNYQNAKISFTEANGLEERIEQLERRQAEVNRLRIAINSIEAQIQQDCKSVPNSPDMSTIMQALSLDIDGVQVIDQSFTAGFAPKSVNENHFALQPLAVSMKADFDSVYSIIENVESMNRLVRVSSIRMTRREKEANVEQPFLEAAIGLHALYEWEGH